MDSGSDGDQIKMKKKKYSKKGQSVPSDSLGFRANIHADIIDPRNIRKIQIRNRKKYIVKSKKQNFMARLRVVIDVNDLPQQTQSHLFRVTNKTQWKYVKKVFYRSRQKVFCSICLQQQIIAPQITYCGHIYCFHCILTHFKLSQKSFSCPVCKQTTDVNELKTCSTKYDQQFQQKDQIVFNLKYRQGHYIFDADTLLQDLNFANTIRMRTKGIIPIYQKQLQQIKIQLQKIPPNDRNFQYLTQALTITTAKISKNLILGERSTYYPLRENQKLKQNIILRFITPQQKIKLHTFYQQKSGSLTFIHKLSKKYLNNIFNKQNPQLTLKSTVLWKQQLDFSLGETEYKELSLFNVGSDVQVVIIDVQMLINEQENKKFVIQYQRFLKQKQKFQKQQQIQLERLRIQYQQQQKYIRKLKEQQQSQFYFDVKLPPTLDPSQINQFSFPSLITQSSKQSNQVPKQQKTNQKQVKQNFNLNTIERRKTEQTKKLQFDLINQIQSFPDLSQIQHTLSAVSAKPVKNVNNGNGKKKKKNKQKFIDVTHEFMFSRGQDQYD